MTFVDVPAGWVDKAMGASREYTIGGVALQHTPRRRTLCFSATTFFFPPLAVSLVSAATEKGFQTLPQSTKHDHNQPPFLPGML